MLACYWIAVDGQGYAYVYRELYQSGLIVSAAAEAILTRPTSGIHATFAPPDLWNRNRDTGRSTAEIFHKSGLPLTRADNDRVQGWYDLKEWLRPLRDEQGRAAAGCASSPAASTSSGPCPPCRWTARTNDTAIHPHELTHAPDALRYFAAGRPTPGRRPSFTAAVPVPKRTAEIRPPGTGRKDEDHMSEILLCAFALALPAAVFWAYRRGLRAGADPARPGKILPETPAAAAAGMRGSSRRCSKESMNTTAG